MNKIIATLVFSAATLGMHSAAMAADPVKAQYKAAVASADADYKEAKAKCDPLKGNEKDVCMKEAKGAQKTAIANAKRSQDYRCQQGCTCRKERCRLQGSQGKMRRIERCRKHQV